MLHMRLKLSTLHLQHYIIQPPSTTLTITLTRHALIATLLEYIASERSAALKMKMFGVSDGVISAVGLQPWGLVTGLDCRCIDGDSKEIPQMMDGGYKLVPSQSNEDRN